MKHILDKSKLILFLETFKVSKSDHVWIHHPITDDLVIAEVKSVGKTLVTLEMPEDSPYAGQPQFFMKKTQIIGLK